MKYKVNVVVIYSNEVWVDADNEDKAHGEAFSETLYSMGLNSDFDSVETTTIFTEEER